MSEKLCLHIFLLSKGDAVSDGATKALDLNIERRQHDYCSKEFEPDVLNIFFQNFTKNA